MAYPNHSKFNCKPMIVRGRDHMHNTTSETVRETIASIDTTFPQLQHESTTPLYLRSLIHSAALALNSKLEYKNLYKRKDPEGSDYIYSYTKGICILPKEFLVTKYNGECRTFIYDVNNVDCLLLKCQSLSKRNIGYRLLK